ncbi:aldo/keto reductase [Piscinibacter gummiphilus]|nr:aldo/keto reductase [Piscinibacter gummiphilus]GLS97666.1 oxidoreductase [Piscinibacter gummiphilus]
MWAKPEFPEPLAMALLEAAVGDGLNYLDTGPSYANGEGERRLGTFLHRQSLPDVIVSTKVGTNFDGSGRRTRSFEVRDMERSFTDSLARLGREQVDILYLHGPSLKDLRDEVFRFLEAEKSRGRIVWSGVNSFEMDVLDACVDSPIDALMIQYNVADLRAERLLPQFRARGKIVVSGTALARAIYDPRTFLPRDRAGLWYLLRALKGDPLFIARGRRLKRVIEQTGDTGARAAMRFVAGHPLIHSATFGTTKLDHMRSNIEAARAPMEERHRRLFFPA